MSTTATTIETSPVLLRHDAGGICTLTLNRPASYNTFSAALLDALEATLDDIAADNAVRVVVLAGSGPAFCAGHDLKEMIDPHELDHYRELFTRSSGLMQRLVSLPQPVIARVHGVAAAAGCLLVAACDLAVAAEEARFATSGVRLGLFCSTPSVSLTRNVPRKAAFEMLVTGGFIDATTAVNHGLVNRAVPAAELDDAVAELAEAIVANPPAAIAIGKRMFYRQIELGMAEAFRYATEQMACNMMDADAKEGIDAFLEKRDPAWRKK
ncbi:MAG: enoyl-CoA hydratase [Gammaproteobacteria bacterium]|nr:enoyl-CoA hydratase [Gammaproteobacteria bacterium]